MNALNSTPVNDTSAFRSWIDHPASDQLNSHRVVVRGWCYERQGAPIATVRARIGDRIFCGWYGDPRPDVFAMFGAVDRVTENSGYEVAVTFPPGASLCVLEARVAEGAWTVFRTFHVTAPRSGSLRASLTWSRLWFSAWLGRPRIWSQLAPDDRDFAVALARQHGWLNLQLSPQYAPRPLAPEVFPRTKLSSERLPKFTIVTPSYQQGAFLEATIRSVLEQPGVHLDYIVHDGGSTDGSIDVIRRYAARLKYWDSAPDQGQADAIVRGFRQMECGPDDVMMYLNSDDVLMPGVLRYVASYLARHPDVDVLYGHRVLIDDNGREIGRWFTPRRRCDDLRLQDFIPQETLFWRRRIWDRVGGIDASFQFALDWDLLLRFAAAGARFARVPRFLGMFRLHTQQKSQAQMTDRGTPEMERLRRRTLGREPTYDEMHCSMRRAQFDSALLLALARRGVRV